MPGNTLKITQDPLDLEGIVNEVTEPSIGAVSTFIGTTRDNFEGKTVTWLEYEAYESMALKKMDEVCREVRARWPEVANMAIHHRLGSVEPREASVIIAVASPHRRASLEAVSFTIDRLKATVPIWKKEVYADGSQWKENKECDWAGQEIGEIVDPEMIQIKASDEEVNRRIDSFIERKREEMNAANVLEFCSRHVTDEPNDFSCARVDAVLVRKTDSSSHLRKSSVVNSDAPSESPSQGKEKSDTVPTEAIEERVNNIEYHLKVAKPVPSDIYRRIKDIEDRVLWLEGISPEYFNHAAARTDANDASGCDKMTKKQRDYRDSVSTSLVSINKRIQELQSKLELESNK